MSSRVHEGIVRVALVVVLTWVGETTCLGVLVSVDSCKGTVSSYNQRGSDDCSTMFAKSQWFARGRRQACGMRAVYQTAYHVHQLTWGFTCVCDRSLPSSSRLMQQFHLPYWLYDILSPLCFHGPELLKQTQASLMTTTRARLRLLRSRKRFQLRGKLRDRISAAKGSKCYAVSVSMINAPNIMLQRQGVVGTLATSLKQIECNENTTLPRSQARESGV